MLVMPYLFCSLRSGGHAAVGIGGQASDRSLCAGSYEVTPPGRSRATTPSPGPTDRPKDSISRQAYGESDPTEDAPTSSLACDTHCRVSAAGPLSEGPAEAQPTLRSGDIDPRDVKAQEAAECCAEYERPQEDRQYRQENT